MIEHGPLSLSFEYRLSLHKQNSFISFCSYVSYTHWLTAVKRVFCCLLFSFIRFLLIRIGSLIYAAIYDCWCLLLLLMFLSFAVCIIYAPAVVDVFISLTHKQTHRKKSNQAYYSSKKKSWFELWNVKSLKSNLFEMKNLRNEN